MRYLIRTGVQFSPSPQIETLLIPRPLSAKRIGVCACAKSVFVLYAKTNSERTGTPKRADLSRTEGFVPIFSTNTRISWRSSVFVKKLACLVSEIHSRRGSTQVFPRRLKSFISSCKAAFARSISSFFWFASFLRMVPEDVQLHGIALGECGSAALGILQLCHRRSAVRHTAFYPHHVQVVLEVNCQRPMAEIFEYVEREIAQARLLEQELTSIQSKRMGITAEQWMQIAEYG